jgi:hypothetical protein
MNLFTYGSLMFVEVWSQLVRGDYVKRPARLHGFTRRRVHKDVYPVIFRSNDSECVDGFEKHMAEAYVLKDCYKYLVNNNEWDPQWFAREALPFFIHNYGGFARR